MFLIILKAAFCAKDALHTLRLLHMEKSSLHHVQMAAAGVVASAFRNAGQTCICANRVFVQVLSSSSSEEIFALLLFI